MSGVDIWYVRPTAIEPPKLIDHALHLLSTTERHRYDRFVFDKHKHEYLATRWLVRTVLATYTGKPPADLTFTPNEYGRPLLDEADGNLRFNLTNTLTLIACSVRKDAREVGIDIEPLARGKEVMSIASTVFMDREQKALATLSAPEQARRAIELWTLKEAYMKARGMGMSLPPDRFEVHDNELVFHDPIIDDPNRWSLKTLELEDHLVSLCLERPDPEVIVREHRFTPPK